MKKIIFISKKNIYKVILDLAYKYGTMQTIDFLSLYKNSAQDFYNKNLHFLSQGEKEHLTKKIEKTSIYGKKILDLARDNYMVFIAYQTIRSHLLRQLNIHSKSKKYHDFGNLKRRVSPPLEAYEYTGTSKLNINPQPPTWML